MEDFRIRDALLLLRDAVIPICANRYVQERPKIINEKTDEFVVVSCPYTFHKRTMGYGFGSSYSMCRIELYVRDVGGAIAINRLDVMLKDVIALFPVTGNNITVFDPKPVLQTSDGNGFHAVFVNCKINVD